MKDSLFNGPRVAIDRLMGGEVIYKSFYGKYFYIVLANILGWSVIITRLGWTLKGIAGLGLLSLSLVIGLIDFAHHIIPNKLVFPFFLSGLIYCAVAPDVEGVSSLGGMLLGFLIPYLLSVISKGGIGGGDVKLCTSMGIWLGYPGILHALMIGALSASITAIILILMGRKKTRDTLAFGPFLLVGFFLVFILS